MSAETSENLAAPSWTILNEWRKMAEAAEARAQKAEAVVEQVRILRVQGWFAGWSEDITVQNLLAALSAVDEPPTGEGGVT